MTNYHPKDDHWQSRLAAIEGRPEPEPETCDECENVADYPDHLCPGCRAYRDHTG